MFKPGTVVGRTAWNLLLSVPVWASDFLAGAAVLRALERRGSRGLPPALRAAASLAIGSGLSGLALFLIGSAGLLKPAVPAVLVAIWAVAGAIALQRMHAWRWSLSFLRLFRPARPRAWTVSAAVLFVLLGAVLVAGLMLPVMEFDSTMYHTRAERYYRETASVAYNGDLRYNAHPQLSELLYLRHWSILGDDGPAKLNNLEFLAMIVLVLVHAGREYRWRGAWSLGLLLIASSPLFGYIAQIEYADLALAAYFTVAVALLAHHLKHGGGVSLVAGALVLGFAGAVKLQGLVLAACCCFGLAAGWVAARRRLGAFVRAMALVAAGVSLSGAGWWVRSWIHTGSPAYPFFAGPNPDLTDTMVINATYGLGHDWRAFLLLPWHLLVGPAWAFVDPVVFGIPGLVLVATALVAVTLRRARPTPDFVFMAVAWGAYVAFWFHTGQVTRYLSVTLPVMALLWIRLLRNLGMPRRGWLFRTLAVLLAVTVGYEAVLTSMIFRRAMLPPVTPAQKEFALTAALPYYRAVRELNRRAAGGDKTYLLFCSECGYYANTESAGDWHGTWPYRWIRETHSAEELVARLRKAGFRWVLVGRAEARRVERMFDWAFGESAFVRSELPLPGGQLVYSDAGYAVFQLW